MADIGSQSFNDTVNALISNGTSWYQDVNASFVLTSGYLVFMMQLGFLLVRPRGLCSQLQLLRLEPWSSRLGEAFSIWLQQSYLPSKTLKYRHFTASSDLESRSDGRL